MIALNSAYDTVVDKYSAGWKFPAEDFVQNWSIDKISHFENTTRFDLSRDLDTDDFDDYVL